MINSAQLTKGTEGSGWRLRKMKARSFHCRGSIPFLTGPFFCIVV